MAHPQTTVWPRVTGIRTPAAAPIPARGPRIVNAAIPAPSARITGIREPAGLKVATARNIFLFVANAHPRISDTSDSAILVEELGLEATVLLMVKALGDRAKWDVMVEGSLDGVEVWDRESRQPLPRSFRGGGGYLGFVLNDAYDIDWGYGGICWDREVRWGQHFGVPGKTELRYWLPAFDTNAQMIRDAFAAEGKRTTRGCSSSRGRSSARASAWPRSSTASRGGSSAFSSSG